MAEVKWTKAQRAAIDARNCSLAVSAAAGSGKTTVLTRRIIEKLQNGADISGMLIVTFTNDAASDLLVKIRKALSSALSDNPSSSHMRRQLIKSSGAKISTISSFCASLVRSNFQLCKVPSDFSVLSDTQDELLRLNIADELINDYYAGRVEETFGKIEDFGAFADTFGKPGDDAALSGNISFIYDKLSNTIDFIDTLKKFRDTVLFDGADFSKTPFGADAFSYILDYARHYKNILSSFYDVILSDENIAKYAEAVSSDIDFLSRVESAISVGRSYDEVKNIFTSYEFPKKPAAKRGYVPTTVVNYFNGMRDACKEDYKNIVSSFFSFGDGAAKDGSCLVYSSICDLYTFLCEYKRRFDAEKRHRHALSFSDIEHAALDLVRDRKTKAPTPLALSLREEFDEIYIDEYQDTNEVQDAIFSALSKGNNRFVVGDIKQSIYAFRSADPSIFENLINRSGKYSAENMADEQKVFLSKNFRSTDEILNFANAVFETQMENGGIMSYGEDDKLYGDGKHGDKVHIALCVKDEENGTDREAEYVAEKIKSMLSGGEKKADGTVIRPSDIVIIIRSVQTHAKRFRDALERRSVPCEEVAEERFFESPEVLLVISLLNVIDNPERDIYLAATLKSPLYGVTLDELLYIRRYDESGSLFSAFCKFTKDKEFKKGLRFLSDYNRYREKARVLSCDELLWQIYTEKEILSLVTVSEEDDIHGRETAKANLIQLYNYARSFAGSSFRGVYDFLSFITDVVENKTKIKLSGASKTQDSVKIISAHKSKGLEFPVCFVCACGSDFNLKDSEKDIIFDKNMGILPRISAKSGLERLNTPQRAIAALKVAKSVRAEEMRVLYVALTRAKERLFITATVKETKSFPLSGYDITPGKNDTYFSFEGEFFSHYAAVNSKNYLEMILPSVAGKEDIYDFEFVCDTAKTEENSVKETVLSDFDGEITYTEAKKIIYERFSHEYENEELCKVPSKISVSKLYPDILDDEGAVDISEENEKDGEIKKPKFMMDAEENSSGAMRGNATHLFMQFFDFDSLARLGINGEIERLCREKFIFPSDVPLINRKAVLKFFSSPLAESMKKSRKLYREKRFIINYPAENLTENEKTKKALSGETLLVQGIIDCAFFDENDELILVDYKTDRFPPDTDISVAENTLRTRHTRQMEYYKYACEKMFGKKCSHAYIYSFALNKTIEI